jgi:hypothetical protein
MHITVFPDRTGIVAQPVETTWPAIVEWLREPPVYPSKDLTPLLKLARFGDRRSDRNSLRCNENVLAISGIEGDYDGELVTPAEAAAMLRAAGLVGLVYTSASHHPDAPHWRVLCPLTEERPPEARLELVERLNGALGGILAGESFTLSQPFHFGRVEGVQYEMH